ncbi:type II-A CRISPR-associated protein Csn2 [Lacticaseibacillus mingshuiensis]|uniref:Type II-A CRISPR-associated protein Csn2 n=1 Tax=Lacticaseibacillus mingshuiensis TaxID=2799574 RepID=A0ABW4CF16_9LACO|nr:type II-A CRISPR-associated protein Csn2 [Lacticaseibacillus mingshuiensis]
MTTLTYFPYAPITLLPGKATVVDTASPRVYMDLLDGIRQEKDILVFANEQTKVVDTSKAATWYGDILLEVDLDKLFQRLIIKQLLAVISDESTVKLIDEAKEMLRLVLESSFNLDIPLDVSLTPTLENIVKFSGLSFSPETKADPYATLEVLLRTLVELENVKIPVLTNLSHYLDVNQLNQLAGLVAGTGMAVLDIEFSSISRHSLFEECQYIWIDSEFNDSRGERE